LLGTVWDWTCLALLASGLVREDPALPIAWRRACVEHARLPLARLVTIGRRTGMVDAATWLGRLEAVDRGLDETAGGGGAPDTSGPQLRQHPERRD
jgi:hypothetical protein